VGCRITACALAGALALGQTPIARAQSPGAKPAAATPAGKPDLAAAKKSYAEGEKRYKAGDYAGAIVEFKNANDIKSTPQAERYIGMCEDALGHFQSAADWYEKFLAHVPEKLATQGDEIKKRDAEIKAMPGKLHIDSNPAGANVVVDDKPQAAPTPTDVELPPGPHTIRLTHPGRLPATKQIDVTFASTQTVTADLEAEPAPPPPPTPVAEVPPPPASPPLPPPEPRSRVPAYVTGGLAIAAAGVGTVFGVMALGDKNDFDKNPTTQRADNGDTHALIADMAFGVALTFGVTSAVLFLTKDETAATPPPTAKAPDGRRGQSATFTPAPFVGSHSGGAGFVLRF